MLPTKFAVQIPNKRDVIHELQLQVTFLKNGTKSLPNAQCEISLQIFRSQKTCQMNWNSILEKTGLEI